MADGSDTGHQGSGAPKDAPAAQVRTYSQREFDDNAARQKVAITDQVTKRLEAEWRAKLGVTSLDDAAARLSTLAAQQPKPAKSEAETIAEKITADYQVKLEAERAGRLAAEEALKAASVAREQEQLRSFLLTHVANTTDPALAMAVFGVPYQAARVIRWVDGHPCVFEGDTPMPHIVPADHIAETLKKPELGFFRKPTTQGSGTRVGATPSAAPTAPVLGRRSSMQDQIAVAVAAGMASRANGSGR